MEIVQGHLQFQFACGIKNGLILIIENDYLFFSKTEQAANHPDMVKSKQNKKEIMEDKVVLIIRGSSGIRSATAEAFAAKVR